MLGERLFRHSRLVKTWRSHERHSVAEIRGPIRVLDSLSGGFGPGPRDQDFIRRRRFARGLPDTINFIPTQQN